MYFVWCLPFGAFVLLQTMQSGFASFPPFVLAGLMPGKCLSVSHPGLSSSEPLLGRAELLE